MFVILSIFASIIMGDFIKARTEEVRILKEKSDQVMKNIKKDCEHTNLQLQDEYESCNQKTEDIKISLQAALGEQEKSYTSLNSNYQYLKSSYTKLTNKLYKNHIIYIL